MPTDRHSETTEKRQKAAPSSSRDRRRGQEPQPTLEFPQLPGHTWAVVDNENKPVNRALRDHVVRFLPWNEETGEPVGEDAPLLLSSITGRTMTTRALQKAFKRCAASAGLSSHYSIHSLRHTFACHLYKASRWNLRLVQKQLGHSSIVTTQVYADVMEPDMRRALERSYR